MTDVVLLGAGASHEAEVPMTFEMTERLAARIDKVHRDSRISVYPDHVVDVVATLNFVCSALLFYDGTRGASPFEGIDVERLFTAVELLAQRDVLEVTPFVADWHPAVGVWDGGIGEQGEYRAFKKLAQIMLAELRKEVCESLGEVSYLLPLVKAAARSGGPVIGTLNYDCGIEEASALAGVSVETSISSWVQAGQWLWEDEQVSLLKLHGSIDWSWEDDPLSPGQLPSRVVVKSATPIEDDRPPVLVFGQRGKLKAEGPFLSALAEFERLLSRADRLVIIGYSFRDDHINQMIRRWSFDPLRRLVVVDPSFPDNVGEHGDRDQPGRVRIPDAAAFQSDLLSLLDYKPHGRATHLRLEVLRVSASKAVSDIFA